MTEILGIFDYFDGISNTDKIIYLITIMICLYVSTRILKADISIIFGLLSGLCLVLFLNDKKITKNDGINKQLELKLKLLDKIHPSYFHIDPNMINLFFSIKDLKQYNDDAFKKAMKTTDNVLLLRVDMEKGLQNCAETFETAEMMANKSLNYMQSFVISIPQVKIIKDKYQKILDRHQILLKRHLDFMYEKCKVKPEDINNTTKIITNYDRERGYNPLKMTTGHSNFELY
jgi:hypothetical protein